MADGMEKDGGIPTNLRLLLVLEAMAEAGVPVTPTEVNHSLGLPKPTIHRLFTTLETEGFIQREKFGDLRDLIGRLHGERATITVGPTDVLTTAHNRLRNAGFSQLPVMDNNRLVGVVTEDAILQFVFGKPQLMNSTVDAAMQTAFIKLDMTASLNNLVSMLQVQPYAAISDGEEFLGLITRSDVLNFLRRQI